MLHVRGKVSLFSLSQIVHHKDCALLVALIVEQSTCTFYMKFFFSFSMASILHASNIDLSFGK